MTYPRDKIWDQMIKEGSIAGHRVRYFPETDSTNARAREYALVGLETGTVFIAETQKKGRGRLERSWFSPPGCGLYFSLLLAPDLPPADLSKITLAAGVALCRALKNSPATPLLKWPNDLLLDGKKVAGILTETVSGQGRRSRVILGIGFNVNRPRHEVPTGLDGKISTMEAIYGKPVTRGDLLELILRRTDDLLNQAELNGFGDILREWQTYDACRGKRLTWLTTEGGVVRGLSRGIGKDGLLRIKDDQGVIHEVVSGDITIQR